MNLTTTDMNVAAELWSEALVPNDGQATLMELALNQALVIIHGPNSEDTPYSLEDVFDVDVDTLFDENWGLNFNRAYDRDDKLNWIVACSVIPDASELPAVKNSVSAKSRSFRGAAYATLIYAALLFQSMGEPNAIAA